MPYCRCNKWPRTQWLEAAHIYLLTVLEVRSLGQDSRVASLRGALENPLPSFRRLLRSLAAAGHHLDLCFCRPLAQTLPVPFKDPCDYVCPRIISISRPLT